MKPLADSPRRRPQKDTLAAKRARYFDVQLTNGEWSAMVDAIADATGFDTTHVMWGLSDTARKEIEKEFGIPCCSVPNDWACIHICRQLGIDHRRFARNEPKLPIDAFIDFAKRGFPQFFHPENEIQRAVQRQKLHEAWIDWIDANCSKMGCPKERHWLCDDRFLERNYDEILDQIADFNAKRPRLRIV